MFDDDFMSDHDSCISRADCIVSTPKRKRQRSNAHKFKNDNTLNNHKLDELEKDKYIVNIESDYKLAIQRYTDTLTSLLPDIATVILTEITSYAMGKIMECNNHWCSNKVFISNQHKCDGNPERTPPPPKIYYINGQRRESISKIARRYKIADRTYYDHVFHIKYYYDILQDICYCYQCRSMMKICERQNPCDEIIFDIEHTNIESNTAYQQCGCF